MGAGAAFLGLGLGAVYDLFLLVGADVRFFLNLGVERFLLVDVGFLVLVLVLVLVGVDFLVLLRFLVGE